MPWPGKQKAKLTPLEAQLQILGFAAGPFVLGLMILTGQGVGCARAFWGRKYTRMVLGQGRKYTRMVLARVARVTASFVHAVRGLICTRGVYTFVLTAVYFVCSMCAGCQVQVFSSLTAVYFVCCMCAGCQVQNNAFWTCVKYVPKQSIP